MQLKKVALILPVYNHLEHTRNCISKLSNLLKDEQFSNSEYHLIVIDDGSTDGTSEWIRSHSPWVYLLTGDGTLWWSGGVNIGAKYAIEELKCDYILLWNNDITPAEDYFMQLDRLLNEIDDGILIGSKIYYHGLNNQIWSYGGTFDPKKGKKYMIGMDQPDSDRFSEPLQVDWLPGMGTLVPVKVISKIGYWDEKVFPQYHGDSDFTYRATCSGFKIIVYPQLKIWNDKSSSGLTHGDRVRGLVRALTSVRSNLNIRKNLIFYKRYSTSWRAYVFLVRYYWKVIGGFMKWKVLALLGKSRKNS